MAVVQTCIEYEAQFLFFTSDGCFFEIEDNIFAEDTIKVMRKRVRYLSHEGRHYIWTPQKWMQHGLQHLNKERKILPLE